MIRLSVKMKKVLVLLLLVFISTLAFAQENYQDVVYLKNGGIIRGVIIEQIPDQSIKIETTDRNVFVYQWDEIEKFTKEPHQGKSRNSLDRRDGAGLRSGYRGIVEFGYQFGVGDYGMDRLKLDIINGYQINPYFSLGYGVGVRYYHNEESMLIPFFADFRTNFMNRRISPYLSLGLGYSFDVIDDFLPFGLLLNHTVGATFKVANKLAVNVGLGYEMQFVRILSQSIFDYSYYNYINLSTLNFVVSLSF